MDYKTLTKILESNKNKSFVKRILEPDQYPVLQNDDGTVSTHRMSWGQAGDKYIVFPTVLYNGKKLQAFDPNDAFQHVIKSKNYILFDSPEEADAFTKRYKDYWEKTGKGKHLLYGGANLGLPASKNMEGGNVLRPR